MGKFVWGLGEGPRTNVMGAKPDSLVDAIDMAMRFNEDYIHSQEVHRKRGLLPLSSKFKKILFVFNGPHKLPWKPSPGKVRPP